MRRPARRASGGLATRPQRRTIPEPSAAAPWRAREMAFWGTVNARQHVPVLTTARWKVRRRLPRSPLSAPWAPLSAFGRLVGLRARADALGRFLRLRAATAGRCPSARKSSGRAQAVCIYNTPQELLAGKQPKGERTI
jgi:hypothetical protein